MLVVGLDKLLILLLDLLRVLAGRAEQQLLQMAEQVLPGLLGHLPAGHRGLQVAGERGRCGGGHDAAPRGRLGLGEVGRQAKADAERPASCGFSASGRLCSVPWRVTL